MKDEEHVLAVIYDVAEDKRRAYLVIRRMLTLGLLKS